MCKNCWTKDAGIPITKMSILISKHITNITCFSSIYKMNIEKTASKFKDNKTLGVPNLTLHRRSVFTPEILDPYWIDFNISHQTSPICPRYKNKATCRLMRMHSYQIATAQWRMVHLGIPWVGPIHNTNMGPIDEVLISISGHIVPLRKCGFITYHTTVLVPNNFGQIADGAFLDPKGGSVRYTHQILGPSMKDWFQYHTLSLTHGLRQEENATCCVIQRHY